MAGWDFNVKELEVLPGDNEADKYCEFMSADIHIYLLSANLTSTEHFINRFKDSVSRWRSNMSLVIPIIIKPCHWENAVKRFDEECLPASIELKNDNWKQISEWMDACIRQWIKKNKW